MVGETSDTDEERPSEFSIFPNPAGEILNVESDIIMNRIEFRNLMGNLLIDKTDTGDYITLIDISNLKPGLYIIRIYRESGEF